MRRVVLESFAGEGRAPQRQEIAALPAIIGRGEGADVHLPTERVSRSHAELRAEGEALVLTDLGSSNGTFVNRVRITTPIRLLDGDVLHFAEHELRLRLLAPAGEAPPLGRETLIGVSDLTSYFPSCSAAFRELMAEGLVRGYAQPIADGAGRPFGFELLGRGTHPDMPGGIKLLFREAEAVGAEIELSHLLRQRCFADAEAAGLAGPLFFNIHPREWEDRPRMLAHLAELRGRHPSLSLVLEVHEATLTSPGEVGDVREALSALHIRLAYDDFGAGQARLLELVEVPPDFLKFDASMVRGVSDRASPRYRILQGLLQALGGLGVRTLAEGIETHAAAEACIELGIDLLQGYLIGRPSPILPSP